MVILVVFLLPHLIAGFDPFGEALDTVVPWAIDLLLRLAGHDVGGGRCPHLRPTHLVLRLEGFEGPLDLLLDLARAQKVDLAKISILALVEQYLAVIEGARRVRLELAADWLVMAAWLTWLKSRLLLPRGRRCRGGRTGGRCRWRRGCAICRRCAPARPGWPARPQLGQEVFARGAPEDHTEIDRSRLALDLGSLVRAYLRRCAGAAARGAISRGRSRCGACKDALQRLGALLGSLPDWTSLERFLPDGSAARWSGARRWPARCSPGWRWRAAAACGCARSRRSARSWCGAAPGGVEEGA